MFLCRLFVCDNIFYIWTPGFHTTLHSYPTGANDSWLLLWLVTLVPDRSTSLTFSRNLQNCVQNHTAGGLYAHLLFFSGRSSAFFFLLLPFSLPLQDGAPFFFSTFHTSHTTLHDQQLMSDTPATPSSQQGSQPNPSTTNASRGQASGAKKTTPAAKLNPDAKDYVPRTAVTDGTATTQTGASSGNNPRHRRRRNPDGNKANSSNPDSESRQPSEGGRSGGNNNNNSGGNVGNANSRNRRNGGRNPRKAPEGGARIDDYHQDDDIEINMDRPIEPTGSQAAGSDSALGVGSNAQPKGRRDGRRKGKESANTGTSTSTPKPQHNRGEGGHARGPRDGQLESSSATRGSGQTGSNNRRQRNRKSDLGGRTFPTTSTGNDRSTTESSSSQRNTQRNAQRAQPKKFVHTVEEDRDLLNALTTGLSNSTYDCMVCWDVIRPAHKIWNCQVCWAAFHLDCLSTWATKSSEGTMIYSNRRIPSK